MYVYSIMRLVLGITDKILPGPLAPVYVDGLSGPLADEPSNKQALWALR